ncbi:Ig-like domain-containing protein [Yersinia intermedia]|uniref:Ig-like domain-containing protein n=1 Tax=Yersinia intermedia TaxID=631 RepID=UPI00067B1394|nr:Ig-like domain-containing protein [Yersinia intermedia]
MTFVGMMCLGLLISSASWANLTPNTKGRIIGHPPVIGGEIYMSGPDANGPGRITLNDTNTPYDIPPTAKGIDYSISNDPSGITVTDRDGDALLGVTISGSSAMQAWTLSDDGTPIPSADLQQPFYPKYSGKALRLIPTADVTATTQTGMPNSATRPRMSNDLPYVLNVPPLKLLIAPLTVTKDNAFADNVDTNVVSATVVDAYGTPQPNIPMTFLKTSGSGLQNVFATTGPDGVAIGRFKTENNQLNSNGFKNPVFAYLGWDYSVPPGSPSVDIHWTWSPLTSRLFPSPATINNIHTTSTLIFTPKNADSNTISDTNLPITTAPLTGTAAAGATVSAWTPIGAVSYQATLTPGSTVGTISVMPLMHGSNGVSNPVTVNVVQQATIKDILVNGTTFSPTDYFPKNGFSNAKFTIELNNGIASDFTWASDASWVSVTDGVVTFTGEGDSNRVTVTATPKVGGGSPLSYAFTLRTWFINNGSNDTTAAGADSYCATQPGYATPSYLTMTNANVGNSGTRAADVRLWDEWGDLSNYTGSGWISSIYWAREQNGSNRYYVTLSNGDLYSTYWGYNHYVACSRTL